MRNKTSRMQRENFITGKMFHDILLKTKCDLEIHRIALKIQYTEQHYFI